MDARQAVLLTPSKPSGPPQLPFRQLRKRITHLESTPTEIFASVASKRLTQTLNTLESTLAKTGGGGPPRGIDFSLCPPIFGKVAANPSAPSRFPSELATHHSPLATSSKAKHTKTRVSFFALPQSANPPLSFQQLAHSSAIFCTFLHHFHFPILYFQGLAHSFAFFGGRGGVLI
jgi:hypothetical protein